jgi:rhodanese-related sulfurtransferase
MRRTQGRSATAVPPREAWEAVQRKDAEILDVRTRAERKRYGWPPGARRVSLLRHSVRPKRGAIYLCQHAVRSKVPALRGAREVEKGFVAWQRAGLPIEREGRA